MAIPTNGGSEILQRGWFENLSTAAQYALFTGAVANSTTSNAVPADTIVTLLNFRATNMGASQNLLNIYVQYGGSTTIFLAYLQPIPSKGTFVFNEKVVLHATDKLIFNTDAVGTTDVSYDFIVQDWT